MRYAHEYVAERRFGPGFWDEEEIRMAYERVRPRHWWDAGMWFLRFIGRYDMGGVARIWPDVAWELAKQMAGIKTLSEK